MAKLNSPVVGYRLRLRSGKPSKVHLRKDGRELTICKFIIFDDTEQVNISDVPAAEICQKCLGAMQAYD